MTAGPEYKLEERQTPADLDPQQFRDIGYQLVEDIAMLLESIRKRPLAPGETVSDVRNALRAEESLPRNGTDAGQLLSEVTELLLDHSLLNGHPRYFGYISGSPAPLGILADMLASAVNPNVGGWILSPMASEMESQALRWIAELVGFPEGGGGVLVSGGNVANMLGFWAARTATASWDLRRSGMKSDAGRTMRAYGSKSMHTWIEKAADLSGLGSDSVRWVDTDSDGRLNISVLQEQVESDLAAGDLPFLVIGTGGSVSTGAVDPLPALRELCDNFGMWFHVDGAYGAFAAAANEASADLKGLALADSLALDPHKWLYTPLEAGCTLVRDPKALMETFSYHPEYYHFDEEANNYFEHGLQNSRGFRALKVWLVLKHIGREGYVRMMSEDIELARRFYEIAEDHPELEAFTHSLSISTYRFVPRDLAERTGQQQVSGYLDQLNREIQGRMEKGGQAFVSNAVLNDTYVLRMCIVNFRTTLEDEVALADITTDLGRQADGEMRPKELIW